MAINPTAALVAVVGLVGLTAPLVALAVMSLRRDEHSPKALREDG